MDLNFPRRKRELAIAVEIEAELLRKVTSITEAAPPKVLAHHFASVCDRLRYTPDDASTGRILAYVSKSLTRKYRVLDDLSRSLDQVVMKQA
jgi:hypothetical protein